MDVEKFASSLVLLVDAGIDSTQCDAGATVLDLAGTLMLGEEGTTVQLTLAEVGMRTGKFKVVNLVRGET